LARDPFLGGVGGAAQTTAHRVHRRNMPEPEPETSYSGLVTRTVAFAIDAAVIDLVGIAVGAVFALVFSILPLGHDTQTVLIALGGVAFVLWGIAYFTWFWTTTGQTVGNRAMRIRVLRVDARPMRARHALVRLIGIVIGLPLFAGYIPILLTDRRRALHDAMAGTVVVGAVERVSSTAVSRSRSR
jgi:uncharacterized RDD family membrane protein YckC